MQIENYNKPLHFYCWSTIIPWGLWFTAAIVSHSNHPLLGGTRVASLIAFAGLLAPFMIALKMIYPHKDLIKDMSTRFFNFRNIRPVYIFITLLLMLSSILLAQAISLLFGYEANQFHFRGGFSFSSGVFPVWMMLIIAPLIEELAWHSYGTDSLRTRFNLFHTSMLFGFFWGLWHFPLSFIKDYYHSNLVETGWIYSMNFFVSLFPFVLIMNWLYYKTNRNIILPILFHISAGFFNEIFATHPMSKVIQTVILLIVSIAILISDRKFFFEKEFGNSMPYVKLSGSKAKKAFMKIVPPVLMMIFIFAFSINSFSQSLTQNIRGKVVDALSQDPLPFSSVVILNSNPLQGTACDEHGNFLIEKVALGRVNLKISHMGYETYQINELLITSGKEQTLQIGLNKRAAELSEVAIRINKDAPLNSMATLSARQFTVEETQRFAGGMDDPARLVSAFAGVTTPSVSSNGISVRGNNPDGLLWRIEGIEVPCPNHFANLSIAGGGLLTVLSSQMMANSDFYTGAFPAEYGNAYSGVFDIRLSNGSTTKRQYTFQAGLIGVDFSTQGPLNRERQSSYIMNYRNSTMALLAPLLPENTGILKYQDLAFKINLPTKKHGTFSIWGIGALDGQEMTETDSSDWKYNIDRDVSDTYLNMFATGLTHKMSSGSSAFITNTLALTGNGLSHKENRFDYSLEPHPQSKAENFNLRLSFQSNLTKRFNPWHINKTGFTCNYMNYRVDIEKSLSEGTLPVSVSKQTGSSGLLQFFTQSKLDINSKTEINAGINAQYFLLNENLSIGPRIGIKYRIRSNQQIGFAYGRHSRIEQLPVYFVESSGTNPNKMLGFMKSDHFVFSYNLTLRHDMRLCIEPYYQHLSNLPVSPNSYISTINNHELLFFDEILINQGNGKNTGVDITFEKFLEKGIYYQITASFFESKYTPADGIERNTRFNKNYVINVAAGKEWISRKSNILSINARLNYMGGSRKDPVNLAASIQQKDVIREETPGQLAFDTKLTDSPILSFNISYRKNRLKHSSVWSFQVLNALGTKDFVGDAYNIRTGEVESRYNGIMIPNVSYKIEF